jgi:hypothetical protein
MNPLVEKEYPIVELYHGTLMNNLPNIMQNGIIPIAIDAEQRVAEAVKYISQELQIPKEKIIESLSIRDAVKRLGESGFKMVYLSGQMSYAISNSKASREWFEYILSSAIHVKHADFYDQEYEFHGKILDIYKQIEKLDKIQVGQNDTEARLQTYEKERELTQQAHSLEHEQDIKLKEIKQKIEQEEQKILQSRFGSQTVVFTVRLPYQEFKRKAVSTFSKERIALFERLYVEAQKGQPNWFTHAKEHNESVWEFFQEIHLNKVEKQYIIDYKQIKD